MPNHVKHLVLVFWYVSNCFVFISTNVLYVSWLNQQQDYYYSQAQMVPSSHVCPCHPPTNGIIVSSLSYKLPIRGSNKKDD